MSDYVFKAASMRLHHVRDPLTRRLNHRDLQPRLCVNRSVCNSKYTGPATKLTAPCIRSIDLINDPKERVPVLTKNTWVG